MIRNHDSRHKGTGRQDVPHRRNNPGQENPSDLPSVENLGVDQDVPAKVSYELIATSRKHRKLKGTCMLCVSYITKFCIISARLTNNPVSEGSICQVLRSTGIIGQVLQLWPKVVAVSFTAW